MLLMLVNPLQYRGNYSATLNNVKLVNWLLMGGLLHLVQRGGASTKCNSPPINGQYTKHRIAG